MYLCGGLQKILMLDFSATKLNQSLYYFISGLGEQMRIAIFDSGLGGITVLNEAMKQLPRESFLYYADTLHVPYGTKPKLEVKQYIFDSIHSIMKKDIKAIVIACNTATSIAIADLRNAFGVPMIGMEPAVKPAIEMNRLTGRRVLVLATPLTLRESKYNELINRVDDLSIVDSLPLPELVEYCEKLNFNDAFIADYFINKLSSFNLVEYGTIVFGCTHYPFYKHILTELIPTHIRIIDGSMGTVKQLNKILSSQELLNDSGNQSVEFICSDRNKEYINKMEQALKIYSE
ncbi:MAG: Glutamate racemase, partial [Bacilli bacterium]|nr:Glutamate racemase [Bacilli bacterium]